MLLDQFAQEYAFKSDFGSDELKSFGPTNFYSKTSDRLYNMIRNESKTEADFYEKRGRYPEELFIHGKVRFNDDEWEGFQSAIEKREAQTELSGIVIKDTRLDSRRRLKLFKDTKGEKCEYGVMRGLCWLISDRSGYVFTRGYIPRTESTNHMEIANPYMLNLTEVNRKLIP